MLIMRIEFTIRILNWVYDGHYVELKVFAL